jgi:hypothetical protein
MDDMVFFSGMTVPSPAPRTSIYHTPGKKAELADERAVARSDSRGVLGYPDAKVDKNTGLCYHLPIKIELWWRSSRGVEGSALRNPGNQFKSCTLTACSAQNQVLIPTVSYVILKDESKMTTLSSWREFFLDCSESTGRQWSSALMNR